MAEDLRQLEEYELYKARREKLIDETAEISRFLDRSIIFVAAGALALSIQMGSVAEFQGVAAAFWILTAGRVALALAVVASLQSLEASRSAFERERQIMDSEACHGPDELMRRSFLRAEENTSRKWTERWNRVTKCSLIVGILLLIVVPILTYCMKDFG